MYLLVYFEYSDGGDRKSSPFYEWPSNSPKDFSLTKIKEDWRAERKSQCISSTSIIHYLTPSRDTKNIGSIAIYLRKIKVKVNLKIVTIRKNQPSR